MHGFDFSRTSSGCRGCAGALCSVNLSSAAKPACTARSVSSRSRSNTSFKRSEELLRRPCADRRGSRTARRDDAVFGEDVAFLHESGLDIFRAGHHARAGHRVHHVAVQEAKAANESSGSRMMLIFFSGRKSTRRNGRSWPSRDSSNPPCRGPLPNSRPCSSEVSELKTIFSEAIADVASGIPPRTGASSRCSAPWEFRRASCERSLGGDGRRGGRLLCEPCRQRSERHLLSFSIPVLITFISFKSSTSPLGQELFTITRSQPCASGTLLHSRPLPPGSSTSMKLRWQFTGHQWHTVSIDVAVL